MPRVTPQTVDERFRSRAKKALSAGKDFQARGVHNQAILEEIRAEIEAGRKELELTTSRCKRKLTAATDAGLTAIRSEVASGMRRLKRRTPGTGSKPLALVPAALVPPALVPPALPELALVPVALALVPVALALVPVALALVPSRKLTKSLWAAARLSLNAPKLPPVPFDFYTAREEMKKANVIDAAHRYAELHGMTIGVVADWFRYGVNLYFRQDLYAQEFEVQKEKARLLSEEVVVPQRKKCSECRMRCHKYGKVIGCVRHRSDLDPKVALGIEARLRDPFLLAAATYAVKREEERPQWEAEREAERERIGALQLVEEKRTVEKSSTVRLAAAKVIAGECRTCASCNEADWMMGSYCEVHERRHAEVYASLIESQPSLCN
jgi:predicted metal-binding protein